MHDLFDRRLTDPTAEEVAAALRAAITALNRKRKESTQSHSQRDVELLGRRAVTEREGNYRNSQPEAYSAVARLMLTWWTNSAGRKLVRVCGRREPIRYLGEPGTDQRAAHVAQANDRHRRPGVWHLDPERLIEVAARGEPEWVAVCGCGAAGSAESLGWQHGMCGPCADRVTEFGPAAVAHAPALLTDTDFEPRYVAFTPDGASVVAVGAPRFRIWDVATGVLRTGNNYTELMTHVRPVVFADGRVVLAMYDVDSRVIDLTKRPTDSRFAVGDFRTGYATGRAGEFLAEGLDGIMRLASACGTVRSCPPSPIGLARLCALWPDSNAPRAVFVSDHSASVARVGADGALAVESQFHLGTGVLNRTGAWGGGPGTVRFTPDGERLLFIRDTEMELWHPARPKALLQATFPVPIYDAVFAPDYEHLFVLGADGAVYVCNPGTLTSVRARLRWHIGPVRGLAVSPDGQTLATAGSEGVKLWPVDRLMPLLD